jgi:hypothetical protein
MREIITSALLGVATATLTLSATPYRPHGPFGTAADRVVTFDDAIHNVPVSALRLAGLPRADSAAVEISGSIGNSKIKDQDNILLRFAKAAPAPKPLPTIVAAKNGMVTLKTKSGQRYTVAAHAANAFAGFVNWLESTGYRIAFIGGYSRRKIAGTNIWSHHARGAAIDINQTARNKVTRPLPRNVTAMAAKFGLKHGAVWSDPDAGHFELISARKFALHRTTTQYVRRTNESRP